MTDQELLISFLDNTAPVERAADLGILRFAKYFFPDRFKDEFAVTHYCMLETFFSVYNPENTLAIERQRYILIHREAAKSTIFSFLIPIYFVYTKGLSLTFSKRIMGIDEDGAIEIVSQEKFIVISSETTTRAENFVTSIKAEIETNRQLLRFFGEKDPRVVEESADRRKTNKMWRLTAFITKDNTVIWALGAGQQTRGMNVMGSRPTLWITDDMYSGRNTKTETTRENLNYWFTSEVINSLDSVSGKIIWLGTMVHYDTVVRDFRTLESWIGLERSVISVEELAQIVKESSNDNGFRMPTKQWCKERQPHCRTLSWPERHTLYSVLTKYNDHMQKKRLNYFYQEYMNEPLAPEAAIIRPDSFFRAKIDYFIKQGSLIVSFEHGGIKWEGICDVNIGCDPASSTTTTSDDTVFIAFGYARCFPHVHGYEDSILRRQYPTGRIFPVILHIEGGKYADRNYGKMPGKVETMAGMARRFAASIVKIETNARAIELFRLADAYFKEVNLQTMVWGEVSEGRKEDRILSYVLPVVQSYDFIVCPDSAEMDKTYIQLISLGMGGHDDYADCLSIAIKDSRIPTAIYSGESDMKLPHAKDRMRQLKSAFGPDWMWYTHMKSIRNDT